MMNTAAHHTETGTIIILNVTAAIFDLQILLSITITWFGKLEKNGIFAAQKCNISECRMGYSSPVYDFALSKRN